MTTDNRLPHWPAALNQKMAAAYCGLSTDLFKKLCPVKPIEFTGSAWGNRYLRQRLEEWLLSLDPNSETRPLEASVQASSRQVLDPFAEEPKKGPGGYSIIDDPTHPIREWYDRLGFDPKTMGQDDMTRLLQEAHERWAATIPGQPLGKREKVALGQLSAFGPDILIDCRQIKNCGPDTEERLKARGFIETRPSNKFPDRIGFYILAQSGYDAWEALNDK